LKRVRENPTIAVKKVEALFTVDEPTAIGGIGVGGRVPDGLLFE